MSNEEKDKLIIQKMKKGIRIAIRNPTDPITTYDDALSQARASMCELFSVNSKFDALMVALTELKKFVCKHPRITMKYDMESFLKTYPAFRQRDLLERMKLLKFANWMSILLKIIIAQGHKGVSLSVVSKFLGTMILFLLVSF